MRSFGMIAGAGMALCLLHGVAAADTIKFNVALDPAQPGQPGKGTANLSLDTASKTLTGTIEYSGLKSPPEMAAFLSPPEKQEATPAPCRSRSLPRRRARSPSKCKCPIQRSRRSRAANGCCCSAPSKRPRSAARSSRPSRAYLSAQKPHASGKHGSVKPEIGRNVANQ